MPASFRSAYLQGNDISRSRNLQRQSTASMRVPAVIVLLLLLSSMPAAAHWLYPDQARARAFFRSALLFHLAHHLRETSLRGHCVQIAHLLSVQHFFVLTYSVSGERYLRDCIYLLGVTP